MQPYLTAFALHLSSVWVNYVWCLWGLDLQDRQHLDILKLLIKG